jgi:hypothetical protein
MREFVGNMQSGLKKTSGDVFLFSVKLISGSILGLTLALIMQEIMGKADNENLFAFFFVIVVTVAAFMRLAKAWSLTAVAIFDLICVLLGICLRLYILVAPGA